MTTKKQIDTVYKTVASNGVVAQKIHCGSSTHVMTICDNSRLVKTMRVDTITHTLEIDVFDRMTERTTNREILALTRNQSYKLEKRMFADYFDMPI